MSGKITIHGKNYPVTDKFQAQVFDKHPDLSEMAYGDLTHRRDELLRLSTMRNNFAVPVPDAEMAPGGSLTVEEYDRLESIVHVINVHHGVNFLAGKSHAEYGFDGVDQVHGNSRSLECGCVDHYVFDHHRRHEEGNTIHFHRAHARCAAHKEPK